MKTLEEIERWIEILEDSKSHQNFQIEDLYSIFQEHTDLEKSLENMRRNKKTLLTQSLTISDTSSYIDENKE